MAAASAEPRHWKFGPAISDSVTRDTVPSEQHSLIARLVAENEALRRVVARDTLTGLYTRSHFDERLEHEWIRAERFWTPLSLIAIDLDDINRLYASDGADGVRGALGWLGGLLGCSCRDIDVVARVGRSSFAVILPGTNRTGAEAELKRLRSIAYDRSVPGCDLHVSFGLAVAFDEAQTPLELLMIADEVALLDKRSHIGHDIQTEPSTSIPTWIDAA
jgi:diguanylate cyclase (GGDEF)-like protein